MRSFDPKRLVRDYGSIDAEAGYCRRRCALFDFSFMARARVAGPGAAGAISEIAGRRLDHLPTGRIRYALRADRNGRLLADLTIWRLDDQTYELMSGRCEDVRDLRAAAPPGTDCDDLSTATSVFALQGPRSLDVLSELVRAPQLARVPYFGHLTTAIDGVPCRIGRLGYTGEAGFEIVLPRTAHERIWGLLSERAQPAGFAAADSLRIEAGFVLFANEFRLPVTARDAGLERFGAAISDEPRVKLVCFRAKTAERPVLWQPSAGAKLPAEHGHITVTSACHSIAAGGTLGLGYVRVSDARPGVEVIDPSGVFQGVRLVPLPFYDHRKERPRRPWTER